jgi:hypothetical protein
MRVTLLPCFTYVDFDISHVGRVSSGERTETAFAGISVSDQDSAL